MYKNKSKQNHKANHKKNNKNEINYFYCLRNNIEFRSKCSAISTLW